MNRANQTFRMLNLSKSYLCVAAVSLTLATTLLYPFGSSEGDSNGPFNDCSIGFTQVNVLPSGFPYFNEVQMKIFVSPNQNITVSSAAFISINYNAISVPTNSLHKLHMARYQVIITYLLTINVRHQLHHHDPQHHHHALMAWVTRRCRSSSCWSSCIECCMAGLHQCDQPETAPMRVAVIVVASARMAKHIFR